MLLLKHLNKRADDPIRMLDLGSSQVVALYNEVVEILVKKQI